MSAPWNPFAFKGACVDALQHRPEDEQTWAAVGASDRMRGFYCDPEQYTTSRAKAAYRLGYWLAGAVQIIAIVDAALTGGEPIPEQLRERAARLLRFVAGGGR